MASSHDKNGRPIVVVTGMGVITSLGAGKADNWARLTAGESGIHRITRFANEGLKTTIAGSVDFIPVETVAYRRMQDSYPDEWIESLKQVEGLEFDTLVPGHGKIGKKEHVRQFREYLETLRAAVREQIQKGASLEETKTTVRLPKYERWYGYADWFTENVEGMYRYLSQEAAK